MSSRSENPCLVVLDEGDLMQGGLDWSGLLEAGASAIYKSTKPEEIVARAGTARIVLTNKTPLTAATLASLPRLRFISVLATGHNVVDTAAARQAGIAVSNVPAYGSDCVAQHTWALILELCNRVGRHSSSVAAGDWTASGQWCYWKSAPLELAGKRLGIIGRGPIGQRVAAVGRAFGMEVMTGSFSHPEGGSGLTPLRDIQTSADILSLHCRLSPEHKEIVNAEFLGQMKPGAFLINTARGGLVCEASLAAALVGRSLGGAALDVLGQEPPLAGNPLLSAPNCLITPHMAWSGFEARRRLVETTVRNVRQFLAGEPVNVVNP